MVIINRTRKDRSEKQTNYLVVDWWRLWWWWWRRRPGSSSSRL